MPTRRTVLAGGAALGLPVPALRAAAATGPVRFGLIADPQYAPVAPAGTRYFGNSLWKLAEAIEALNAEPLDFVVTLGDLVDRHWESFSHILPIYDRLVHPTIHVPGNHDYFVHQDWLGSVQRVLGIEGGRQSFVQGGVRFLALDANEVSLHGTRRRSAARKAAEAQLAALAAAGAVNAQDFNAGLSAAQTAWIGAELRAAEAAGERVIVFCHYPILPDDMHNLWNATEVAELLVASPAFAVWFNGHNHAGNHAERDGRHFVTLRGMVETPAETAWAIVTVEGGTLRIDGRGREPSRLLAL
jgi:3',5'-cyclic AMP phosphodiesterase CpdA